MENNNKTNLMYTGFKSNTSINKSLATVDPNETQLQSLQREVDNYTRKLQQQKRKYFSIQDTFKNVTQEYQKQKIKLNQLKKQNSKAHNVMLQAKIKNLEANLDKAISTYDDTVAHNNKLKNQIDMLRREKKNYMEMQVSLEDQIKKFEAESQDKLIMIEKKKKRAEELKEEIMQIKTRNQAQRQQYFKKFDELEREYMSDKRDRETLKYQKSSKPQAIDTQPLLKHRLKRMIVSNKQKLKMIDQYKKHMKQIECAFNDIKQKSGIASLEEITTTFIKSQEQNYSLYHYMDQLSRNIDGLEEENAELQRKIEARRVENDQRKEILRGVSEEEKGRMELAAYVKKKEESVAELTQLIERIKPALGQTLIDLSKSKFNDDPKKTDDYALSINITDRTIEQYLSDLEKYINILLQARQQAKTKLVSNIKESTTAYSRPIPPVNYEQIGKQKDSREENRFIDEGKFRQYANEYWERRKNKGKEA